MSLFCFDGTAFRFETAVLFHLVKTVMLFWRCFDILPLSSYSPVLIVSTEATDLHVLGAVVENLYVGGTGICWIEEAVELGSPLGNWAALYRVAPFTEVYKQESQPPCFHTQPSQIKQLSLRSKSKCECLYNQYHEKQFAAGHQARAWLCVCKLAEIQ